MIVIGVQQTKVDTILQQGDSLRERIDIANRWLEENSRVDREQAALLIDRLLAEAESEGDLAGSAWLRFHRSWLYIDINDFDQAFPLLESICTDFTSLGDNIGLARSLNALGAAYSHQGLYDAAMALYQEAMTLAEEIDRPDIASAAGFNLSHCCMECGEFTEAIEIMKHFRRHYSITPHNMIRVSRLEGEAYRSLGQLEDAERSLLEGVRLGAGSPHETLDSRHMLAETYLDLQQLSDAERLIGEGLNDADTYRNRYAWTWFKLAEARLYLLKEKPGEAIHRAQEAITCAVDLGARKIESDGEYLRYKAWRACGEYREALQAFECYSDIKDEIRSEQTSRRMLALNNERARREARHFETLYGQVSAIGRVGHRIASHLELEKSFETIHSTIIGLMDLSTLIIALVNEEKQRLDYHYIMVKGSRREPLSCDLSEKSFGCWCVNHRSDIIIGDLESEYKKYVPSYEELLFDDTPELSMVYIPLFLEERVVGFLSVQSSRPHAYDLQKVEILRAIGGYISIAIQNSLLFKEVQLLASRDALTGLPNRRCLMEELDKAYKNIRRYGWVCGIIMCDVDHFKQINDTFGHDIGDLALRFMADALLSNVRETDTIGRFGGEEFVVILPETDGEQTLLLAERLRKTLEQLQVPVTEGKSLQMTASFGVSIVSSDDSDYHSGLKRADSALYQAKSMGRNCVCQQ